MIRDADRQAVNERFLDRMVKQWSPPRHLNEEAQASVLAEYMDALARFTAMQLDAGWKRIRGSHGYQRWPTVKECCDACEVIERGSATDERRAAVSRLCAAGRWAEARAITNGGDIPSEPRKCSLDELMRSPQGQAALKAGRARDLEIAWRTAQAWPEDLEQYARPGPAEKCLAASIAILEADTELPFRNMLLGQARHRQERERDLAERYG